MMKVLICEVAIIDLTLSFLNLNLHTALSLSLKVVFSYFKNIMSTIRDTILTVTNIFSIFTSHKLSN